MPVNIALLNPQSSENLATALRSGQNLGAHTIMVVGGFIEKKYQGSIHKFTHQMDTQNGVDNLNLVYFKTIEEFLQALPARTTLVVVEMLKQAESLETYKHPQNGTYIFGTEKTGISRKELQAIESYVDSLYCPVPGVRLETSKHIPQLEYIAFDTPQSLNLGVSISIVLYDRHQKKFPSTL
jgi:tRNA(Leu) C34 or U34 (ribose-2'-O)-methylase TrmL